MAFNDPRYERVNEIWQLVSKVACSRAEAAKAQRRIYRKFGLKSLGGPLMREAAKPYPVRVCWIDPKAKCDINKGWPRLGHDISHHINRLRHPNFRPHDDTQARLEYEVACYIVSEGFMGGTLAPKKSIASEVDKLDQRLARWLSKQKRATNAIVKLEKKRRRLLAKM